MPWRESASAQVRASAIWPTAAAPCESSSLSAPLGSLSTARPSAIAPEETTSTSRLPLCRDAMSSASDASQSSFTRPALESTRSEEPTFTTMRRKSARAGDWLWETWRTLVDRQRAIVAQARCLAAYGGLRQAVYGCQAASALPRGSRTGRLLADHLQQRAQRLRHALPGRRRDHQRRLLAGALEPRDLLLQLLPASARRPC